MPHKFVILISGNLKEYDSFESIPLNFDNVVQFLPEIPDGPHTDQQHQEIEQWTKKLSQLMKREKNASGN